MKTPQNKITRLYFGLLLEKYSRQTNVVAFFSLPKPTVYDLYILKDVKYNIYKIGISIDVKRRCRELNNKYYGSNKNISLNQVLIDCVLPDAASILNFKLLLCFFAFLYSGAFNC